MNVCSACNRGMPDPPNHECGECAVKGCKTPAPYTFPITKSRRPPHERNVPNIGFCLFHAVLFHDGTKGAQR